MTNNMPLCAGDWVEILSKDEILRTLDKRGQLEGLPFMPGMFDYCGRRFKVYKRAHKTCDTVNDYKGRRMNAAVHLEGSRCDGKAYGGCDAGCLIYWKEAWLKRVAEPVASGTVPMQESQVPTTTLQTGCTEEDVWAATKAIPSPTVPASNYVCQVDSGTRRNETVGLVGYSPVRGRLDVRQCRTRQNALRFRLYGLSRPHQCRYRSRAPASLAL